MQRRNAVRNQMNAWISYVPHHATAQCFTPLHECFEIKKPHLMMRLCAIFF
jgi:hypothetical protein